MVLRGKTTWKVKQEKESHGPYRKIQRTSYITASMDAAVGSTLAYTS